MADALFHPEAEAEYQCALGDYRARSTRRALDFEQEVERILGMIATFPEMYPTYDPEHRFAVLRRFPFSIVYRVESGQTYVIALAHSSRAPGYWRGRG